MLRVARVTAVLATAACAFAAACFSKPGEPHENGGGSGVDAPEPIDARPDGNGTGGACTHQPFDDFNSAQSTDCGMWGTRYGSATPFGRTPNGELSIPAEGAADLYCQTTNPFDFQNGTSIEIPQIADNMSNTYFRVMSAANQGESLTVTLYAGANPQLSIDCPGTTTAMRLYDSFGDRWWKLDARTSALGTFVHAAHGSNGASWTDEGSGCAWTNTSSVLVRMGVGGTTYGAATPALFDNFNIKTCPP